MKFIMQMKLMKKLRILWMGLLVMAMSTANAQEVNEVVDSVKSGLKSGNVKDAYSKISDSFKVKKASADTLIGTWQYVEPAVYATKGNLLLKLAENAVANNLEDFLRQYVEKSNITQENTSFTFHKDGTFDRVIA